MWSAPCPRASREVTTANFSASPADSGAPGVRSRSRTLSCPSANPATNCRRMSANSIRNPSAPEPASPLMAPVAPLVAHVPGWALAPGDFGVLPFFMSKSSWRMG